MMFSLHLLSLMIAATTAHPQGSTDLFSHILRLERTVAVLSTKLEAAESQIQENKAAISTKISKGEVTRKVTAFENGLRNVSQTLALQKTDIAFEASLLSDMHSAPDNVALRFTVSPYNKGDGFSRSTGIFTAPVSGTYMFWAHIMSHGKVRLHVFIEHNGAAIAQSHTDGGIHFETPSITTVAFINKGDKICFMKRWGPSSVLRGDSWSSYGGVLIRSA